MQINECVPKEKLLVQTFRLKIRISKYARNEKMRGHWREREKYF